MARSIPRWSEKYPRTIDFAANSLVNTPQSSPQVWNAFLQQSHLTDRQAIEAVRVGTTDPLLWFSDLGSVVNGLFDPGASTRIQICTDIAERFEIDSQRIEARQFLESKILHEMVHWALFSRGEVEVGEAGVEFERKAYNDILTRYWISGSSPNNSSVVTAEDRVNSLSRTLGSMPPIAPVQNDNANLFKGHNVTKDMPRGIRNNNPGNIRRGDPWKGLAEASEMTDFQRREVAFAVFKEPEWGMRAMIVILRKYYNELGLRTPTDMIGRWAPASDNNDVNSYAGIVANAIGIGPREVFDLTTNATKMIKAMVRVENGIQPYADIQFDAASQLV